MITIIMFCDVFGRTLWLSLIEMRILLPLVYFKEMLNENN
jgi:hypothetical protein